MTLTLRPLAHRPGSWWAALAVSLVAHGALVGGLWLFPGRQGSRGAVAVVVDTRVKESERDINVTLESDDPPHPKSRLPRPPAPARVATSVPPAKNSEAAPAPALATIALPFAPSPRPPSGEPSENVSGPGVPTGQPGGKGPAETTRFFHIGTAARTVAYVIDRSASMGPGGALQAAKRELLASLGRLPPDCRFQVIFYNRQAEPLWIDGRGDLLPATTENKRRVALALSSLLAEGGTEHVLALRRALAFRPEAIYLLTDAGDLQGEQIGLITRLNQGRTAIHAVELTAPGRDGPTTLPLLTAENGGLYRAVSLPPDRRAACIFGPGR